MGRGLVVMLDIAHQLASQVGDEGEDAPRRDILLDRGDPEFDLIEPGRIGRSVKEKAIFEGSWLSLGAVAHQVLRRTRIVRDARPLHAEPSPHVAPITAERISAIRGPG